MRVLLIEDHRPYAELVARELAQSFDMSVSTVPDPVAARPLIEAEHFDVIVVDLFYTHLTQPYARRRLARNISLTADREFHISGLAVQASRQEGRPPLVISTTGEDTRELHIVLASEDLGVCSYYSKGTGDLTFGALASAIEAAADGRHHSDPELDPYLPRRGQRPISELLFGRESWRGIWRACALQIRGHRNIASLIGYSPKTVRIEVGNMVEALNELNPGLSVAGSPSDVVVSYADRHWEFFLDDTVMRLYPPPGFGKR
ncbi:hypothetical protein [Pseudofrankia sp. BMG5.36]|uniref:response regulator n=1 Tax=Pseudofrankia sp. BMG5.36 TaxID=1834512 RepID=UPI001041E67A|nr:hypothetical protein [Pseudofrankia sp. BMG5.36]